MRYKTPLPLLSLRYIRTKAVSGLLSAFLLAIVFVSSAMAEVPEQIRSGIDRIIGGKGTYNADEGVYKLVLPRTEATVVLDYQKLSPNIGLNSWVAFTSAVHREALLTGQFLLLEDEADAVLTTALNAGLQVTGLADSSLFGRTRVKILDVAGIGTYQDLASAFRKGLDEIRRIRTNASRTSAKIETPDVPFENSIDPGPLNTILSMRGGISDGVYKATIGRHALLYGESVGREMGISSWIAVAGTDNHALAQGEFVATSEELQDLLKALRSKDFKIVSIRNHLAGEHPQLLFVRFWQQGRSVELARGLRYALDVQVGAIPSRSAENVE